VTDIAQKIALCYTRLRYLTVSKWLEEGTTALPLVERFGG